MTSINNSVSYSLENKLQANFILGQLDAHQDFISNVAKKKVYRLTDNSLELKKQVDEATQVALTHYKEGINKFTKEFGRLKKAIKPTDLTLKTYQYFMNLLKTQFKIVQINNPDDLTTKEQWKELRQQVAYADYSHDQKMKGLIQKFLQGVEEKLKILPCDSENQQLKTILDSELFNYPELLFIEIAYFVEGTKQLKNGTSYITLSVPTLQKSFNQCLETLMDNFEWVFKEIADELSPFIKDPQHPNFNNSSFILKALDNFKDKTSPLLPFLNVNDLTKIELIFNNFTESIFQETNYLTGMKTFAEDNETERDQFPTSDAEHVLPNFSTSIKVFEIIVEYIEREELKLKKKDSSNTKTFDIDSFFNRNLTSAIHFKKPNSILLGSCTLLTLKRHIEALHAQLKCHILIENYLKIEVIKLVRIFDSLLNWYQNHSSNPLVQNWLKDNQPKDTRSIDQLVHEIGEISEPKITKKTSKKGIKNKAKNLGKKEVLPKTITQNTISKGRIAVSSSLQPQPTQNLNPSSPEETISSRLHALLTHPSFENEQFRLPRAALRQSLMHLYDLQFFYKRILKKPNEISFQCASKIISSSYYFMEQWMRYHGMIQKVPFDPHFLCREHNLHFLMQYLKTQKFKSQAPYELYLGNFWTVYYIEQINGWEEISKEERFIIPKALNFLSKICNQATSSEENFLQLEKYYQSSIAFSEELSITDPEGKPPSVAVKPEKIQFLSKLTMDLKNFDVFQQAFQKSIDLLSSKSNHPAILKIQQAQLNLNNLKDILTCLHVSSDEISTLIRNAIFWQNAVLECLFKALYFLKNGQDVKGHDLAEIHSKIKWSNVFDTKEVDLLKNEWSTVNYMCRYPFEYTKPISSTHELILKAELLRENPDLYENFMIKGEEKARFTPLNFIPLSPVNVKSSALIQQLQDLLKSAENLIEKRLLPELLQESNKVL